MYQSLILINLHSIILFFFSISKNSEEDPFFQTSLNKKLFPHPPTQSFNTDSGPKEGRGAVFQSWPLHVFDDPKKDLIFYHLNQIYSADCKWRKWALYNTKANLKLISSNILWFNIQHSINKMAHGPFIVLWFHH